MDARFTGIAWRDWPVAMQIRFGAPKTLPPQHEAWTLEAMYLGQALATIVTILSPQRIIIGGGVMHQSHLLPRI
jgi:fructokinase